MYFLTAFAFLSNNETSVLKNEEIKKWLYKTMEMLTWSLKIGPHLLNPLRPLCLCCFGILDCSNIVMVTWWGIVMSLITSAFVLIPWSHRYFLISYISFLLLLWMNGTYQCWLLVLRKDWLVIIKWIRYLIWRKCKCFVPIEDDNNENVGNQYG